MAVAFDAVGPSSAGIATSGTSLSWDHTCSGGGRLLVVSVSIGRAGGDTSHTTSVTYGGTPMTSIAKIHSNNNTTGYVQMFYLVNPPAGTDSVQVTGNQTADMVSGSVSLAGVDQTTPIANTATNWGSGTNMSVSITSASGNMVIDGACCGGGFVAGSTQTNRWSKNYNTFTAASNGAQSTADGATSVSMGYNISDDWWSMIAVDVVAGPTDAVVVTGAVTDVTPTTATGHGAVVIEGGSTITERGVCWSTSSGPTTSDNTATAAGTIGSFSASMTGLSDNTLYYVRAYAVNAVGTYYGDEVTFMNYAVKVSWIGV